MLTTAGYILAVLALGVSLADLDLITIGMVMDLCLEKSGEGATEVDAAGVDRFFGG